MKPSEFYEKYWRINGSNGELVSLPPLSDSEKSFLDEVAKGDCTNIYFMRTRKRQVQIDVTALKEDMNKLPPYFFPANQPKLDKYGQIIEDERNPLQ